MNLPAIHNTSAEELLNRSSLELLRVDALERINNDVRLTPTLRKAAIRELDFLLEYERLRRVRLAERQYRDERREYIYRVIQRREEVINQLRLARARTGRAVARLRRDIANCRLEILVQVKKLRPNNDVMNQAKNDLLKLQVQHRIARLRERELLDSLERKTMKRAAFMDRVRKEFPDMAEELIDNYDQMAYRSGDRRQT